MKNFVVSALFLMAANSAFATETITTTAPRLSFSEGTTLTGGGGSRGGRPQMEVLNQNCGVDSGVPCAAGGSGRLKVAPSIGGYQVGDLIEGIGRVISILSKTVEVNGKIKVHVKTPDGLEVDIEIDAKVKVSTEKGNANI